MSTKLFFVIELCKAIFITAPFWEGKYKGRNEMGTYRGRKIRLVLQKKWFLLVTLLVSAVLLYAQQARARSSPRENLNLNDPSLQKMLVRLNNPFAKSYLSFNPFTLREFQPSLSSLSQFPPRQRPAVLFPGKDGDNIIIIIKRPPVRIPIRPPLRSPYIAYP